MSPLSDEAAAVGPGGPADPLQHPAESRAQSAAGEGPVQHLRSARLRQGGWLKNSQKTIVNNASGSVFIINVDWVCNDSL